MVISNRVNQILEIINEYNKRKYPEYIFIKDLENFVKDLSSSINESYDKDIEYIKEEAYEEGHEEGYDKGYDEGLEEGKENISISMIKKFIDEIIKFKKAIKNDPSIALEEIQLYLTQLIWLMDEDTDVIPYTDREKAIEEIDEFYSSNNNNDNNT